MQWFPKPDSVSVLKEMYLQTNNLLMLAYKLQRESFSLLGLISRDSKGKLFLPYSSQASFTI